MRGPGLHEKVLGSAELRLQLLLPKGQSCVLDPWDKLSLQLKSTVTPVEVTGNRRIAQIPAPQHDEITKWWLF